MEKYKKEKQTKQTTKPQIKQKMGGIKRNMKEQRGNTENKNKELEEHGKETV